MSFDSSKAVEQFIIAEEQSSRRALKHKEPEGIARCLKGCFRIRSTLVRQFLGEMLATFILISFGCASVAQFNLGGKNNFNSFLSVNLSWGLAVTIGIVICGNVSGAHMNPAVSLAMLLVGKISFLKFIVYSIGQSIGAFFGSILVYVVYIDALNAFDGGVRQTVGQNASAGIWATYPSENLSVQVGFLDQFFGTALLVLVVLAVTDTKNNELTHGVTAFIVGMTVTLIGITFGMNCGFAINPVRDFIPRLFTCVAGWGTEVFTAYNYFFWVPMVAPFLGSIVSTVVYSIFISNHWPDSQ